MYRRTLDGLQTLASREPGTMAEYYYMFDTFLTISITKLVLRTMKRW